MSGSMALRQVAWMVTTTCIFARMWFCRSFFRTVSIVRRNLILRPGEKGYLNRFYRRWQDRRLARRHRMTDFFFDLQPLEPRNRLAEILRTCDAFRR